MKKLKTLLASVAVIAFSSALSADPMQGNFSLIQQQGVSKSVNYSWFCSMYPRECFCFIQDGERRCIPK